MFDQNEIDTLIKSTFHITIGIQGANTDFNIELIKKSWNEISTEAKEYLKTFLNGEIKSHNLMMETQDSSLMTNLGTVSNAQKWIDFYNWIENN
jgi:hypothetical protein